MAARRRPAFWNPYWLDHEGTRIRRVWRAEYAELWRLWGKHKDIREGRASMSGPLGNRPRL